MATALFPGRFQPFHKIHLKLIKLILKRFDRIIIMIGSAQYGNTKDNPFTFEQRKEMIKEALEAEKIPKNKYKIIGVEDVGDNNKWVAHVTSHVPKFDAVYSNNPLVTKLFKKAGFKVLGTKFYNKKKYSGTNIRKLMKNNKNWRALVPDAVFKLRGQR